ncbi:ATP-binding cassette domain-containing protein [Corynebacterium sp. zg254]|uniref:ABC transporter ATP-binding protein n=1 Tax=Corynebacterium sp. zg254 TaxID=2656645 RepID=UPI00215107DB|nr:ABC transporter ATP-binding protein [Corynebacterium sp. zg254]MCR5913619.1 ATP-binding cassette domain-containing protein [Corynebacterium sp. zg254]
MEPSPNAHSPALSLIGVSKRFGMHYALNNFTLDIPRGSFYGVVGPNGAGKTTAILIATGLLEPDAGRVSICGHDIWSTNPDDVISAKQHFGLLADSLDVFDRLSGREYLSYLGNLRGLSPEDITQRTNDLLSALDLEGAQRKYIADYSAGMTKKILLAGALLHNPRVLILDEPFEAVDPVSGQVIRQILRRYVTAGGTVVMSSHVMELVENLCDHVAIVNEGTVRAAGPLEELAQGKPLVDRFVELVGARHVTEGSLTWLDDQHD